MNKNNKLVDSFVEIKLFEPDDFNIIRETLTRIGIGSNKNKTLYQSCHILHKNGKYYLVHFLEMFMLDGKGRHFSDEDKARRNTIAALLQDWELVEIVNPEIIKEPRAPIKTIKIVPFKQKSEWNCVQKYSIGGTKTREDKE